MRILVSCMILFSSLWFANAALPLEIDGFQPGMASDELLRLAKGRGLKIGDVEAGLTFTKLVGDKLYYTFNTNKVGQVTNIYKYIPSSEGHCKSIFDSFVLKYGKPNNSSTEEAEERINSNVYAGVSWFNYKDYVELQCRIKRRISGKEELMDIITISDKIL